MLTLLDQNIASWAEKMRNTEVWFHTSLAPNARHVRPMEPVFWGIWGLTRTTFSFRPNWADLTAEAMKSELNHSSDFVIRIRPSNFKNSNSGFHLQDASETTVNHHDTHRKCEVSNFALTSSSHLSKIVKRDGKLSSCIDDVLICSKITFTIWDGRSNESSDLRESCSSPIQASKRDSGQYSITARGNPCVMHP